MAINKKIKSAQIPVYPLIETLAYPPISDDYAWLDYFELMCLTSLDKCLSKGAIVEDLDTLKGISPHLVLMTSTDNPAEEEDEQKEEGNADPHDGLLLEKLSDDKREDLIGKNESIAKGIIYGIIFRQRYFGAWYPFEVIGEAKDEIRVRDLTNEHRLYIQLLLSSSLRMIPQQRWKDLTEPFEEISLKVFKVLMPTGWQVHRFGAKGVIRYKGTLYKKLQALSVDIKARFVGKSHYFKKGNNADGGLDLVAWHSLGDLRSGSPAALAQCGCTLDGWPNKSLEASPARLKNSIVSLVPWLPYYFMHHDLLVEVSGKEDWQRGNDITECIFVDRFRILTIIKSCEMDPASIFEKKIFNEFAEKYGFTTI